VLLHGNDRLCGAIEQHLATTGCRVSRLHLQDDHPTGLNPSDLRLASILADAARADTLALARAAHAGAMVCLTDSDAVNFQIALLVHAQSADVPVIVRVVSPELSAHVSEHGDAIAISPTAIAGKEFSAAAVLPASR
jgi:Trk K+ transport system NAD-binding subunit